jgi:hypothetical protein
VGKILIGKHCEALMYILSIDMIWMGKKKNKNKMPISKAQGQ